MISIAIEEIEAVIPCIEWRQAVNEIYIYLYIYSHIFVISNMEYKSVEPS